MGFVRSYCPITSLIGQLCGEARIHSCDARPVTLEWPDGSRPNLLPVFADGVAVNVLLWNQDWFAAELRALGHTAVTMGYTRHLDVNFSTPLVHVSEAFARFPGGVSPDLLIVHDNSAPIGLLGLETVTIPMIFYSVDTHHHSFLHRSLARVFDTTFVAQRDYIPPFEEDRSPVAWLPLWASEVIEPVEEKSHGAVFVGTLNPALNPDRVRFFGELERHVPLLCMSGKWQEIFPRSEIVINQTVKGDLNFRVFEAMGAGALLLTERTPNGLFDLFNEGEHLITYTKGDVAEAAHQIRTLLANPARTCAIAARGRAEVLARHCGRHRLETVLRTARTLTARPRRGVGFHLMHNYAELGRRLVSLDATLGLRALAEALTHAEAALEHNEPLSDELSCQIVVAAVNYDRLSQGRSAERLLERLLGRYGERKILALPLIRAHLNRGSQAEAAAIAQRHLPDRSPPDSFALAENVLSQLIGSNPDR